jgi:prepilin signal peptidase PulO-like enzyme (type II secretory pathway)
VKFSLISPMVWTLPFGLLGAMIGSFLNVVIYRLPRGLSVSNPRWSFCPACNERIAFRDNIPILGWLMLRGRCRRCGSAIPHFYPIVECITFLVFIALWDIVFISVMSPLPGRLASDLPVVVAFASLFAGLIAGAGMDIESYTIDIRIPLLTSVIAVLCHGYRGLPNVIPDAPPALPPTLVGLAVLGGAVWLVGFVLMGGFRHSEDENVTEPPAMKAEEVPVPAVESVEIAANAPVESSPAEPQAPEKQDSAWPIVTLTLIAATITAWIIFFPEVPQGWQISAGGLRGFAVTSLLLLVLILASMVHRPGDVQIINDIEGERFRARPTALREFAGFLPAIVICGGMYYYLRKSGQMSASWADLVPRGDWRPWTLHLYGALAAVAGAVAAAVVGWTVRILGTLAFGKEAFGTGDIYLLAAIGAAGGLAFTIFAFFMAALLALIGVVAMSIRKSSRAIPFGPWLGLGALSAMWLERPLTTFFAPAMSMIWSGLCGRPLTFYGG